MNTIYNRIAAGDVGRIAALSDGIFAFAATILVIDIHTPELAGVRSEADLLAALWAIAPLFLTWLMSLMTLGIFWVGQQTQHDWLAHSDRAYTWLHMGFLMAVCLLPFSTDLLAEYIVFRTALLVYWLNILALGLLLLASWMRAKWFGLVKAGAPKNLDSAFIRRVVVAQLFYAFGAGLCFFSTWWSIGFIVAVQLVYVIGPRFRPFTWMS